MREIKNNDPHIKFPAPKSGLIHGTSKPIEALAKFNLKGESMKTLALIVIPLIILWGVLNIIRWEFLKKPSITGTGTPGRIFKGEEDITRPKIKASDVMVDIKSEEKP